MYVHVTHSLARYSFVLYRVCEPESVRIGCPGGPSVRLLTEQSESASDRDHIGRDRGPVHVEGVQVPMDEVEVGRGRQDREGQRQGQDDEGVEGD